MDDQTVPASDKPVQSTKPRRPWAAFLLSILSPGLGQLYAGAPLRALVTLGVFVLVLMPLVLVIRAPLSRSLVGVLVSFGLSQVILLLPIPLDGAMTARRKRHEPLTRWNRSWIYVVYFVLASVVVTFAIPWVSNLVPFRSFRIPSGAMMDTLLVGDVILVDMRHSRLSSVKRGDILVFDMPREQEVMYIKRLIGMPGDTVEIRTGTVYVNGVRLEEPYVNPDYLQGVRDFGPARVPAGHYFMLGDHRNASYDSREWGAVSEALLRGKVTHIYYSVSEVYAVSDVPGPIVGAIRWERFGRSLAVPD